MGLIIGAEKSANMLADGVNDIPFRALTEGMVVSPIDDAYRLHPSQDEPSPVLYLEATAS
jgi:hypothetical protein